VQQQARTRQLRAPERSLAARNVSRAGKDEANWLREYSPAPREAHRASPPVGTPNGHSSDTPMGAVAPHTALLPEKGVPEPHPGVRNRS